jgi:hypothetical protein
MKPTERLPWPLAAALACLLAVLLPGGAAADEASRGVQVYLRDVAYVDGPLVRVGEVATLSASTEAERRLAADGFLALPILKPTLLPGRIVTESLTASGAAWTSVSGPRVAVIPSQGLGAREKLFYERLLRAVDAAGARHDARVEVSVLSVSGLSPLSAGPDLKFTSISVPQVAGSLAGRGTVAYRSGDSEGSAELWVSAFLPASSLSATEMDGAEIALSAPSRAAEVGAKAEAAATLAPAPVASASRSAGGATRPSAVVRAGDSVTLVFRKGNVAVSAPGRAQGSGGVGETVSVRSLDGKRTHAGTVLSATEVAIDVP